MQGETSFQLFFVLRTLLDTFVGVILMLGIAYITTESLENASIIARELVSRKLAACVNMFPVSSIYRWNDKIEEDNEIAMFVKTDSALFEEIKEVVRSLHTYELPAIEFWGVEGEKNYLEWIRANILEKNV